MKTLKKFLPFLLMVVMLFCMTTVAFAANDDDGSITVTNATVGYDYAIYKVFDLTYSGDKVAYTYDGSNAEFLAALQTEASPFVLSPTPSDENTGPFNVSLKNGKDSAAVSAFLTAQIGNLTQTGSTKTASSDTVVFDGLAYGYYYITSSLGSTVTIDSTMKYVEVIDKNQGPTWDDKGKTIVDANGNEVLVSSANYGETVNFKISVNATAYNGDKEITNYYIKDILSAGFSEATITAVTVNDAALTAGAGYSITKEDDADGNHVFEINIPYDSDAYGSNATIEVTYSAVVQNTAVLAGADGNTNTANYTWIEEPDPDDPPTPPDPDYPGTNEKKTKTYVYALGILKVDQEGNKLSGAEFTVTDADGSAITAVAATDPDTGEAIPGVYNYSATGTVTQFATDANGVLVIKGVAAGEYEVTEAIAPLGYNLLLSPVTVEAEIAEAYTTTITYYLDADGQVTDTVTETVKTEDAGYYVAGIVVVNNAGTELPSTGGIGTTIFYILGGILLVSAGVLLFVRRRAGYEK